MPTRVCDRLPVIFVGLFFFLAGPTRDAASQIVLDNDVDISWTNGGGCRLREQPVCQIAAFGAPRLVPHAIGSEQPLAVVVNIDPSPIFRSVNEVVATLNVFDANGKEICLPNRDEIGHLVACPLTLRVAALVPPDFTGRLVLNVNNAADFDLLPREADLIFAFRQKSAQVEIGGPDPAVGDLMAAGSSGITMTLAGAGHQLVRDTIGDRDNLHRGDTRDLPRRSMNIVGALSQLDAIRAQRRGVDLDVDGRDTAGVGFTHGFDLEPGDRIESATLSLQLRSSAPSGDFILLDRAVRNLATGEQGVPLTIVRHLLSAPPAAGESYAVTVDLTRVPVISSYPSPGLPFPRQPDRFLNVLGSLNDGRLNVIVGNSGVDFADLTLKVRNIRDDAVR